MRHEARERRAGELTRVCAGFALALCGLATPTGAAEEASARAWLPPGVYRLEMRVAATAEHPRLGTTDTLTVSVSRVEIEYARGALVQHHRVCGLWDASQDGIGRVHYPDAFVSALPPTHVRSALVRTPEGIRYEADLGREWLGMASGAALPREADDPAVRDSDGDGRPGVTIEVKLPGLPDAELQLAQRTHPVLKGWLEAPGRLMGRIEMREFAQRVLAASGPLVGRPPRVRHDPERSRFELVRDPDAVACAPVEAAALTRR